MNWSGVGVGLRQPFVGDEGTFILGGSDLLYVPKGSKRAFVLPTQFEDNETTHFEVPEHEGIGLQPGEGSFVLKDDILAYEGDEYKYDSTFRFDGTIVRPYDLLN